MTPDEFLEWITEPAKTVCSKYNLPWQVCVAQGALESGWGRYKIGDFNIFGRKWNGTGDYTEVNTWEVINGEEVYIVDRFQLYATLEEAIDDWCQLMEWGRYEPFSAQYKQDGDIIAFAEGIAGIYATDPQYASKIVSTMRACDLI